MQTPRLATPDLVDKETPESSFAIFQKMLQNDKIDIFLWVILMRLKSVNI